MLLAMLATKTMCVELIRQIFPTQQGGNLEPTAILPELQFNFPEKFLVSRPSWLAASGYLYVRR